MLGLMTAPIPAVRLARISFRSTQRFLIFQLKQHESYSAVVSLPENVLAELSWWQMSIKSYNSLPIMPPSFDIVVVSDSSLEGWGAVCDHHKISGKWSSNQRLMHINELELLACFLAVRAFTKNLSNCSVLCFLDNVTAIAYINHEGGTKSRRLTEIAQEFFATSTRRISLSGLVILRGKTTAKLTGFPAISMIVAVGNLILRFLPKSLRSLVNLPSICFQITPITSCQGITVGVQTLTVLRQMR